MRTCFVRDVRHWAPITRQRRTALSPLTLSATGSSVRKACSDMSTRELKYYCFSGSAPDSRADGISAAFGHTVLDTFAPPPTQQEDQPGCGSVAGLPGCVERRRAVGPVQR